MLPRVITIDGPALQLAARGPRSKTAAFDLTFSAPKSVSVLFGVILGGKMLGEGSLTRRLAAAAAVVAGIIAIAIG